MIFESMNSIEQNKVGQASRREFLKSSTKALAGAVLANAIVRPGYTAEDNTIQVALIGCGGRGTGAAGDALSTKALGPIKLVAMADVFENRLRSSYSGIKKQASEQVDVPEDRRFIGFDAYKKAIDCLKPGDVAIFATPLAFRWVHFTYAIEKGINVFMEKPITADGATTTRMFKLADAAKEKNLKVGVGLMSRHSRALQELAKRIQDGELGDIILQRGYRMHGPGGFIGPRRGSISELLYQVRNFHSFIWAGGGIYSDFYIHIIDHLCWLKNAWPVQAMGIGGRHYKTGSSGVPFVDQNFDIYGVEYTYPDGTKLMFDGRCMTGCSEIYCSFIHGTKGIAVGSKSGDCGLPSRIYKGQNTDSANLVWESNVPPSERSPYKNEWMDLITAIRKDQPYNEARRGAEASLVTSMGRFAAHTGQIITYQQMLENTPELAPQVAEFTTDSEAPVKADANGKYPIPQPGKITDREY